MKLLNELVGIRAKDPIMRRGAAQRSTAANISASQQCLVLCVSAWRSTRLTKTTSFRLANVHNEPHGQPDVLNLFVKLRTRASSVNNIRR